MNQIHRPATGASGIRPCTSADMPAVADLFQRNFRDRRQAAPASLAAYFHAVYLENPDRDPDLAPLVFIGPEGTVDGFVGILSTRMTVAGRPVRAAVAGALMVDRPAENPLAGARLLRAYFSGPQDLSITESANPISQAMWERLGATVVPGYSLEWIRVLRPAGFAIALAAEKLAHASLLAPVGSGIDALARRAQIVGFAPAGATDPNGREADEAAFAEAFDRFSGDFALRPDLSRGQLLWRLGHARSKDRHGDRILRIVDGRGGAPVGCYAYYGRPRGIAWAMQVLARPQDMGRVVDDMLADAHARGCVGMRGRITPSLSPALLTRRCVFLHRSSTMYRTGDPELAACLRSGDALVTGLAGESWSQLIGHNFQ